MEVTKKRKLAVTSLTYFSECRRQWWLGETWEPKKPQLAFWTGSLVHAGLEEYYKKGPKKGSENVPKTLEAFFKKTLKEYQERGDWDLYSQELESSYELGRGMLQNYMVYDESEPLGGKVQKVEERIELPLFTSPSGEEVTLVGRIDLIIERKDGWWIIDHKTAGTLYDTRGLDVDEQVTAYAYLVWRKYGIVPAGVIYNVLLKDLPTSPRIINKGKGLSQDKSQKTVYELYLSALEEYGFPQEEYQDFLTYLQSVGWGKFFSRDGSTRNEAELKSYEVRAIRKGGDILNILDDPDTWAYPNPQASKCSYCSYLGVCKCMEDGGDYQSVLDSHFSKKGTR